MRKQWLFYLKLLGTQSSAVFFALFVVYGGTYAIASRAQTIAHNSLENTQSVLPSSTITPTAPNAADTIISLPTITPIPTIKPTTIPTQVVEKPTSAPPPVALSSAGANLSAIEQEMVTLINQKRGSLPALVVNAQLVEAARRESRDNASKGNVNDCSHTGSDGSNFATRAKDVGYTGFASGETIGCGHQSAQAIVDGWWNSPGHHDILTNGQITTIGVGWVAGNQTAQSAVVGY